MMRKPKPEQAMALVIVLSFLVILSILLVTFVTVTLLDRSASRNYAQGLRAGELAQGGLDLVVADLQREIRAGSSPTPAPGTTNSIGGTKEVFRPRTRTSVLPARYGAGSEPNVIRRSLADTSTVSAAYPSASYDSALLPPVRASAVPTTTRSANRRSVSRERWARTELLTNVSQFAVPEWVYVTRSGPRAFSSFDPAVASPASDDFVLGRFAYVIYDAGGLLDINVAGFPTGTGTTVPPRAIGGKAYPVFADLRVIPGISAEAAADLVTWRNAWSQSAFVDRMTTASASGFRRVLGDATGSDNTFVGRQDLIAYATRNGFTSALRYLGTFSRELNSPSLPARTDANLNPDFSTLFRNNQPIRRFPLSRFALLEQNPANLSAADASDIQRFFGLQPAGDANSTHRSWTYISSTIGTPQAAIAAGRDPNLFELVKAAMDDRSLGVVLQNNGLVSELGGSVYSPESNVHQQVARIIANIADQYDADNYPTTIQMGSNPVYGIESLPYFSEMLFKAHFPSGFSGGTGALYTYFELWNPHQGPIPSNGPTELRIRTNPDARVTMNYIQISAPSGGGPNGTYARVNSSTPELPPSVAFPTTPILVNSPASYQSTPRIVDNPSDTATRLNVLNPVVNGWQLVTVNQAIPASWTGSRFTSLAVSRFVPVLEFQDGSGAWRPYTTFAGHFTSTGSTGLQEAGRPFMNNFNGGGGSANTNSNNANISFAKADPRTFRFRSGVSFNPTPNQAMIPASLNGQALDQDRSGSAPTNPGLFFRNQTSQTVADLDSTVRPGDGYLSNSANPMQTATTAARPVVLNRPFRSIGELGYVFRDMPWKSLDFFSAVSADGGLLDLFCLEETDIVAGRVNLNTRNPEVLNALLVGALRDEVSGTSTISASEASTISAQLTAATQAGGVLTGPFRNRLDLPTALALPGTVDTAFPAIKSTREAAVRALGPNTQTRTWNLLIDLIAETGRFLPRATALDQFTVEGARRLWLHVAIDRWTGEVIDSSVEVVYE